MTTPQPELSPRIIAAIHTLEAEDCAVAVFTPEELHGLNTDGIEDIMISAGNEAIHALADHWTPGNQ